MASQQPDKGKGKAKGKGDPKGKGKGKALSPDARLPMTPGGKKGGKGKKSGK